MKNPKKTLHHLKKIAKENKKKMKQYEAQHVVNTSRMQTKIKIHNNNDTL